MDDIIDELKYYRALAKSFLKGDPRGYMKIKRTRRGGKNLRSGDTELKRLQSYVAEYNTWVEQQWENRIVYINWYLDYYNAEGGVPPAQADPSLYTPLPKKKELQFNLVNELPKPRRLFPDPPIANTDESAGEEESEEESREEILDLLSGNFGEMRQNSVSWHVL
jgi:hypothetical protein